MLQNILAGRLTFYQYRLSGNTSVLDTYTIEEYIYHVDELINALEQGLKQGALTTSFCDEMMKNYKEIWIKLIDLHTQSISYL